VVFSVRKVGAAFETFGVCKISPEFPVCADANVKHAVTAVGVRSGRIHLFNRSTGEYLWGLGSNGSHPKRVIVTTSFPFVVVQYSEFLRVYSISGDLIRELKISFDISCWCSAVSDTGLDYVFISDMVGHVLAMEVFTLKIDEFFRGGCQIVMIKYSNYLGGIIAFTQEGKGIYHPYLIA
jgi:hypothetical protein